MKRVISYSDISVRQPRVDRRQSFSDEWIEVSMMRTLMRQIKGGVELQPIKTEGDTDSLSEGSNEDQFQMDDLEG